MNSVIRWKVITGLFVMICLALTYRIFDQGITHTYLKVSEKSSLIHINLLTGLIAKEWVGQTKKQVLSKLNAYISSQQSVSIVLKRDLNNTIYLEGIRFEFIKDRLVKVE